MSNPYWSIKHVETMSDLPDTLTRGRAYFVDDDQVIVIDHGRGPVIYGGKPGPQGIAGDPLPQLQEQVDDLAAASFSMQALIYELHEKYKNEDTIAKQNFLALQQDLTDRFEFLSDLSSQNASAILSMITTLKDQFEKYDNSFAILTKSIMNLYPATFNPDEDQVIETMASGDIVSSGGQNWTVSSYANEDGMITFTLSQ